MRATRHRLTRLFDSLDPSPFLDKDLDPKAEEYIVESVGELPPAPAYALAIHLDRADALGERAKSTSTSSLMAVNATGLGCTAILFRLSHWTNSINPPLAAASIRRPFRLGEPRKARRRVLSR